MDMTTILVMWPGSFIINFRSPFTRRIHMKFMLWLVKQLQRRRRLKLWMDGQWTPDHALVYYMLTLWAWRPRWARKDAGPNACQKKTDRFELKYLFQFPAQPAPYLGLTKKTTSVHCTRNQGIWRLIFRNIFKSCCSFWMDHKLESICAIIDRFWSIYDVRRYGHVYCSLYPRKRGNL